MTGVTLTKEQSDFAAENHDILIRFMKQRGLPEDEYYDILVFPFISAVQAYDADGQEDFAGFAMRRMGLELSRYLGKRRRENDKVKILSLDYVVSEKENLLFGDLLADNRTDFANEICRKLSRPTQYRLSHISQNAVRAVKLVGVGGMCV